MVMKMDVERFILKQLNEEVKEQHQVPAELIQAGVGEYCFLRYINLLCWWNKEELAHQWKESNVVPIHKKGDKTDCTKYRGISVLSTSYNILSNILLSRLIPYTDEII
jgi:hypothetical protein